MKSEKDERPDFMIKLGLLPPYSREDVKQAYFAKANSAHPDHGGDVTTFRELREAYSMAEAYVELNTDRRSWIASRVDEFLKQQEITDRLNQYGAEVTTDGIDWMARSFGDFSLLTEAVTSIRLTNCEQGDEVLRYMVSEQRSLDRLKRLELTGSRVSDGAVLALGVFQQLEYLDLSRTRVSGRALRVVEALPNLQTLKLERTSVGWWSRHKAHSQLRRHRRKVFTM